MNPYRVLEIPWIYNLVQIFFGSKKFSSIVRTLLEPYKNQKVLELGSGTGAFSQLDFPHLYVSDINESYLEKINLPKTRKAAVSAVDFSKSLSGSWDVIYSVGLYHHLSDADVLQSLDQCFQQLSPNGQVLFIDNIYPTYWNPFAYFVRRLDRGQHVRTKQELENLLKMKCHILSSETGSYSWCGLEYIVFRLKRKADDYS